MKRLACSRHRSCENSDCLGRPQKVPATTVGVAYGDAYLAGMGVGTFDDFGTLRNEWVSPDPLS